MSWAERMGIAPRRQGQIPLGVQLAWGLRSAIVRGELQAGERLPTLREFAEDIGANLNTIRAVYMQLERDGLIETHQGKGSYVLAQPASAHVGLSAALAQALRAAREMGLTPQQLAAALYVAPDSESKPDPEAVARRQMRAEIAVLEGAMSALYAEHPGLPVSSRPQARSLGPRILSSDGLRLQRDAVLDQLVEARAVLNEELAAEEAHEARRAAKTAEPRPASSRAGTRARIAPA